MKTNPTLNIQQPNRVEFAVLPDWELFVRDDNGFVVGYVIKPHGKSPVMMGCLKEVQKCIEEINGMRL